MESGASCLFFKDARINACFKIKKVPDPNQSFVTCLLLQVMISYDQPLKNLLKIFNFFFVYLLIFLLFNLLTGLTKITGLLFNLQLRKQF